MNDLELSELAKQAMIAQKYDEAHAWLEQMQDQAIALGMALLVIAHEAGTGSDA